MKQFARDIGLGGAPDRAIAAHARATQAALLTRDLDFADVRNYPPEQYNGIVVFRFPDDVVAKEIARLAEIFLREPKFVGHPFRPLGRCRTRSRSVSPAAVVSSGKIS